MTLQIHSDIVRVVTEKDHIGLCHRDYPKSDALVTNTPGVALLVFTADTVVSLQLLRRAGDPAVLSLGNLRAA